MILNHFPNYSAIQSIPVTTLGTMAIRHFYSMQEVFLILRTRGDGQHRGTVLHQNNYELYGTGTPNLAFPNLCTIHVSKPLGHLGSTIQSNSANTNKQSRKQTCQPTSTHQARHLYGDQRVFRNSQPSLTERFLNKNHCLSYG